MMIILGMIQIAVSIECDVCQSGVYRALLLDSRYRQAKKNVMKIAGRTTINISAAHKVIRYFSLIPTAPCEWRSTALLQALSKTRGNNHKSLITIFRKMRGYDWKKLLTFSRRTIGNDCKNLFTFFRNIRLTNCKNPFSPLRFLDIRYVWNLSLYTTLTLSPTTERLCLVHYIQPIQHHGSNRCSWISAYLL